MPRDRVTSVFWTILAIGLLLLPVQAEALDPLTAPNNYGRASWGDEDGLLSGPVRSIVQDQEGFLWLGTDRGLLRFDGAEFRPIPALDKSPLAGLQVRALLAARDGSIWAGGAAGVIRISQGRALTFLIRDGLPLGTVAALAEDSNGSIWAGGYSGVVRFAGARWEHVAAPEGLREWPPHVNFISFDQHGGAWVSTPTGVFHRPSATAGFKRATDYSLMSIDVDAAGHVWGADGTHGVRRLFHATQDSRPMFVGELGVRLLRDSDGNLWIGTPGNGLWRTRTDQGRALRPEPLAAEGGIHADDPVNSMLEDRQGNLWVGIGTRLLRLSDRDVTMLGVADRLPPGGVAAVAATSDQRIWAGASSGLYRIEAAADRPVRIRRVMRGSVNALHLDDHDRLWLATVYRNIGEFDVGTFENGHFTSLRMPPGTLRTPVTALATDREGGVWICSVAEGLQRWFNGAIERYTTIGGLNSARCGARRSPDGRIWFGLSNGALAVYEAGTVRLIDISGALGVGSAGRVAVHVSSSGSVWLTRADVLAQLRGNRWVTAGHSRGLLTAFTGTLIDDGDGRLWTSVKSGIVRIMPPPDGRGGSADFTTFDESNGLAGAVGIRPGGPAAARTPDGRLWFATARGVAVIDPRNVRRRHSVAVPWIDQVVADGRVLSASDRVTVPSGATKVEVHYGVLDLSAAQWRRFRYRLEGVDADWVDAGDRRQAFYTNLSPRVYRFHVGASDNHGGWSGPETVIGIDVRPTFTQTTAFVVLLSATGVGVIAVAWWLRLRVVEARFASILQERARVARELHDTLLQELGSVAVELESATNGLQGTASASSISLLRELRCRVTTSVRDARDYIERLRTPATAQGNFVSLIRDIAKDAKTRGVACSVRLAGGYKLCSVSVEEQLLRIAQEATTNAIRHAAPREVVIELDYDQDSVALSVTDDGTGFDPIPDPDQSIKHWGVAIMKERATMVGGSFSISSAKGQGTKVQVVVPFQAEPMRV
jgi:signal transduction histidine kinase/ligand-binding sensor domain-containing protein